MKVLKIGSRGSELALAQTRILQEALFALHPNLLIESRVVKTAGDRQLEDPLGPGSPLDKGAFTKELERYLLRGEFHAVIHSLKDLPTEIFARLTLAAILPRGPVEDILVSKWPGGLSALPQGAHVATGSSRRKAQILMQRPDLTVDSIRGNVPTRIRKLAESENLAAVILASAGLERLELPTGLCKELGLSTHILADFLPAPGQGAIAIQTRKTDSETRNLLASIHDSTTAECVHAERSLLAKLGGGCHLALGAHAKKVGDLLSLKAIWFADAHSYSAEAQGAHPEEVAQLVFEALTKR